MKYKTAFRLALRAIGVLLVFQNLPHLVSMAGVGALTLLSDPSQSAVAHDTYFVIYFPEIIGSVFGVLCGLYLFFRGRWFIDLAIPSNRPYCHECGYDLTGLAGSRVCPECGTQKPIEGAKQDK